MLLTKQQSKQTLAEVFDLVINSGCNNGMSKYLEFVDDLCLNYIQSDAFGKKSPESRKDFMLAMMGLKTILNGIDQLNNVDFGTAWEILEEMTNQETVAA